MIRGDRTHVVTVNVVAQRPKHPIFLRDVETILTGFQMLPPEAS